MIIEEHKQLNFEHALYFRKKLQSQEMNSEIANITEFLRANELNKNGAMASATLGAERTSSGYVMDIEVICPIDGEFQSNEKYKYLENFLIDNALYARYEGQANLMQNAYMELSAYIGQSKLTQNTAPYNVTIKEPTPNDTNCILDIYIGVK